MGSRSCPTILRLQDQARRPTSLNEAREHGNHPRTDQRGIDFDRQTLAGEHVLHRQDPDPTAVIQPIRHEVHAPLFIRADWRRGAPPPLTGPLVPAPPRAVEGRSMASDDRTGPPCRHSKRGHQLTAATRPPPCRLPLLPVVERRLADAELPAEFGHGRALLGLAQGLGNLLVGVPGLLHAGQEDRTFGRILNCKMVQLFGDIGQQQVDRLAVAAYQPYKG